MNTMEQKSSTDATGFTPEYTIVKLTKEFE